MHTVYKYLKAACDKTGVSYSYDGYYLIKNQKLNIIAIVLK